MEDTAYLQDAGQQGLVGQLDGLLLPGPAAGRRVTGLLHAHSILKQLQGPTAWRIVSQALRDVTVRSQHSLIYVPNPGGKIGEEGGIKNREKKLGQRISCSSNQVSAASEA